MPKFYKVALKCTDWVDVYVEAESESEARLAALEEVCQSEDPLNDFSSWSDGWEAEDIEEVVEDEEAALRFAKGQ